MNQPLVSIDDLWEPDKLEAQTAALRACGQCRWSFTNVEWIDAAGGLLRPRERLVPHAGRIVEAVLTIGAYIALPTVLVEQRRFPPWVKAFWSRRRRESAS